MKHPLGHFPCEQCKARAHPLDLIANLTQEQRDAADAESKRIKTLDTTIKRTSAEWEAMK